MGSDEQKIGDFYNSAMDSVKLEKDGISPLLPYLKRVDAVTNLNQLWLLSAEYQTLGISSFFNFGISQDEKNSDKMAIQLYQGGLGMPNRDYYLKNDAKSKSIQLSYTNYLRYLDLISVSDSDKNDVRLIESAPYRLKNGIHGADSLTYLNDTKAVYDFEFNLAKKSRALEDLRDPIANYHNMSLEGLKKLSPHLDWVNYFKICGIKNADSVIVGQPEFFIAMDRALDSLPLITLKHYLKMQVIGNYSSVLSKNLFDAQFDFYGKVLRGLKEPKPRWKRALDQEESAMGMLLGRLFIHSYFSEQTKLRYVTMVNNVLKAFEGRINGLTWMSPQTKALAIVKLHSVTKKVGYPDKWKDFTNLTITKGNYLKNVMSANKWAFDDNISKFGKPVDRSEWGMTPQTYNAYYNPSNNEIVLPVAQFLVPGIKDEDLDDAVVYGYSAASTIGHEITHGFDDEGRQFDEKGNLKEWWSKEDASKFTQRAQKMIDQFNAIKVLDSLHINGKACLGENIADLGGILIGLDAFKQTAEYKSGQKVNGLSPLQRFFLGYSLGWLGSQRDESLSMQILTDVHAPAKYRVNGPMQNVPEFYTAFGIKPGDPMYREEKDRVKIW